MIRYLLITLRGMGMGAADIIPGVSGGTIALITGIYEKLISSIKSVNFGLLKIAYKEGVATAWRKVNGTFLVALFAGIFISIFSLARLISWLLEHHKIMVWAFFFGLIAASAIYLWRKTDVSTVRNVAILLAGAAISFMITLLTPATTPDSYFFTFLAGCIAICAMILPGISGSFILLLIGKYEYILNAVKDFKADVLGVFVVGCVLGIVSFAHLISWLFKKFPAQTLSLLTGFMVGSLNKLWPWKEVLETRINSAGELVPVIEKNVSPFTYAHITGENPLIFQVIFIAIVGFALVFIFEYLAGTKKDKML